MGHLYFWPLISVHNSCCLHGEIKTDYTNYRLIKPFKIPVSPSTSRYIVMPVVFFLTSSLKNLHFTFFKEKLCKESAI